MFRLYDSEEETVAPLEDHPIFKKIEAGDLEGVQNFIEVKKREYGGGLDN